jgi:hypothetical protein
MATASTGWESEARSFRGVVPKRLLVNAENFTDGDIAVSSAALLPTYQCLTEREGGTMNFVILVPIAWIPVLIIAMVLGDYLFTVLAWFVLGLAADVILYILLMPVSPAAALEFAICLLLIPLLAPFVGCYVRYKREQRQELEQELGRAERKRRQELEWAEHRRHQELEWTERKRQDDLRSQKDYEQYP